MTDTQPGPDAFRSQPKPTMTRAMACESCHDQPATRWTVFDRGDYAGAAKCSGHEIALCEPCRIHAERKGCPHCFW